ncbi:uncharacterized protein G2W53_016939 [Senna tora]|uniref:Uncharacterized protein n=1 Tax=Senna tora TaxID=362788 RepID=A0A834TSP2_9FABA|nr:uncharacterized protein G2W53_016939 [Senna tora]
MNGQCLIGKELQQQCVRFFNEQSEVGERRRVSRTRTRARG